VRAPNRFPIDKIDELVDQKKEWIKKKLEASLKRLQNRPPKRTLEEIRQLRENAVTQIQNKIDHFSQLTQTPYRNLKISNAKRRWGTCTSSGQIHINWRLVLAPEAVLEYVIIHELMHIREMSHSRTFWKRVEAVQTDYKKHRIWLKDNGHILTI
jgi:predicted metal-dependent hydrolase